MVRVMKTMATSFKRICACTVVFSAPTLQQATVDLCSCQRLLDTHRQVWLSLLSGHSFFLLAPVVHKVLFVPSKSLFSQSCVKFYNQIPLPSKVKFPGGSQSLCQIPRLGNLLWVLEFS